jgi:hypothetical protein
MRSHLFIHLIFIAMNAKEEFLRRVNLDELKCAGISLATGWDDDYNQMFKDIALPIGYSELDLNLFLDQLDLEYDSGYGSQELFGTIWMN